MGWVLNDDILAKNFVKLDRFRFPEIGQVMKDNGLLEEDDSEYLSIHNINIPSTEKNNVLKFEIGDKVKVVTDRLHYFENLEHVNLKDFIGVVTHEIITHEHPYYVDINGYLFDFDESDLVLVESNNSILEKKKLLEKYPQEYDDIDGVILKDQNERVDIIKDFYSSKPLDFKEFCEKEFKNIYPNKEK